LNDPDNQEYNGGHGKRARPEDGSHPEGTDARLPQVRISLDRAHARPAQRMPAMSLVQVGFTQGEEEMTDEQAILIAAAILTAGHDLETALFESQAKTPRHGDLEVQAAAILAANLFDTIKRCIIRGDIDAANVHETLDAAAERYANRLERKLERENSDGR
jgi:hypothetical protein